MRVPIVITKVVQVILVALLLAARHVASSTELMNSTITFNVGLVGPVTSVSQSLLAAMVAFDIDFRKNFEPALEAEFGAPIIEVRNLHPELRIKPLIGTTDSNGNVASRTVLNWAAGLAPFPQVVGIVGGMNSTITEQVALVGAAFELPQVGWGATSTELSDDVRYPYFSRTVLADDAQGGAAWAWMQHFEIPAAAVCYISHESYGHALFHAMVDAAGAEGSNAGIHGVAFPGSPFSSDTHSPEQLLSLEAVEAGLHQAHAVGSRFMVLFMPGPEAELTLYALELKGMLYNGTHQILASESALLMQLQQASAHAAEEGALTPSQGLPLGFQKLSAVTQGPLFARFSKLWQQMLPSHLYGPEARWRYQIDDMIVPLESGSSEMLTAADFANTSAISSAVPFIFDALYCYVLAINELLNRGTPVAEIRGRELVRQIRSIHFEGATGNVSFDAKGDRHSTVELLNVKPAAGADKKEGGAGGSGEGGMGGLGGESWEEEGGVKGGGADGTGDRVQSGGGRGQEVGHTMQALVAIGRYSCASKGFTLQAAPTWATGEVNMTVPVSLRACPAGFEENLATGHCQACSPGTGCGFDREEGFPIGIYSPATSLSHSFLAVSILFDLDFRKNTEPALRERFGDPIIKIPNLHPDLKIKTQLGTSDSRVSIGMQTILDWLHGIDGSYKVAGIVGGYHSAISGHVASMAEVFGVPQVSFASTSPTLSDKSLYPWFSRAIPPGTLLTAATWAWMEHFEVPSVVVVYTREAYAEPLFQAVNEIAINAGQAQRIMGIGVSLMSEADYDHAIMREAAADAKNTGTKFVFMFFGDPGLAASFMYAMEEKSMLYASHQILMSHFSFVGNRAYIPSNGMPHGLMKFESAHQGKHYPAFMQMWNNMTPEDLYGVEPTARYMLNHFKVQLSQGARQRMTEEEFQSDPFPSSTFIIDAAYTFVFAINNLLNSGVAPQEIQGRKLLEAVRAVHFEGVTGMISYDENGDRQGNYDLYNVVSGDGGDFTRVGSWSAVSGQFSLQGGGNVTWANGVMSSKAPAFLTACAAGTRWDRDAGLCIFCPLNFFSEGGSATRCQPCPGGTVGNTDIGATGCVPCAAGRYRAATEAECQPCATGTFAATPGSSACETCRVGSYAPMPGMSHCEQCGANRSSQRLFTTMSTLMVNGDRQYYYLPGATTLEDCGCDQGTREDINGECIPCVSGMICKGMNDVTIEKGYYAAAVHSGELSVFVCHGDSGRCEGGVPGHTCAAGRREDSITCTECLDGMTPSGDGSCETCQRSDLVPFAVCILACILICIATYNLLATSNRATQSHSLLLSAIAMGMLLTVTQQLGIVGMLTIDYEEPLRSVLNIFGLVAFDIEVLRVNCVSSMTPLGLYLLKVCLIFIYLALMGIIHICFVLCRHHGNFREQHHAIIGAVGTMFMVFYIAVTSTVLEPLQCQDHPNGRWTVRSFPSIICWEDHDHQVMLIVGVLAFFAVPLSYLVACMTIVVQFGRRMQDGDSQFLKAFSFLFFRFRPSQHSYIVITMLRSLAVALVLVLPDVIFQAFALQVILLASLMATLHRLPWRVVQANVLDCFFSACTLLVICLCSLCVEQKHEDMARIASLAFVVVVVMLVLAPCVALFGVYQKYFRMRKPYDFFLCHHKAGAGAFTRLLKMHLLEHPRLHGDVFVDSDNLDNLDHLFNYVGNDTNTLVVVCSSAIFTRPWCLGEMCTARLKSVPTMLVLLPNSELPDSHFICDLESRLGGQGVEVLTENGITMDSLTSTLQAIGKLPERLEVPERITCRVMQSLVSQLINRRDPTLREDERVIATASARTTCPLLYDRNNMEAAATALILKKMATPVLTHVSERIPELWDGGSPSDVLRSDTSVVTILCTNGAFERSEILEVLLHMPRVPAVFMPVICEPGFRIPRKDLAPLLRRPPAGMHATTIKSAALCVQHLFKEIAITFNAQHMGDAALNLAAKDVAKRLLNPLRKCRSRGPSPASSQNGATLKRSWSLQSSLSKLSAEMAQHIDKASPPPPAVGGTIPNERIIFEEEDEETGALRDSGCFSEPLTDASASPSTWPVAAAAAYKCSL